MPYFAQFLTGHHRLRDLCPFLARERRRRGCIARLKTDVSLTALLPMRLSWLVALVGPAKQYRGGRGSLLEAGRRFINLVSCLEDDGH